MDTSAFDVLKKIAERRHSVREYDDRDIPDDMIDKIIDIAKSSPYASGRGNWGVEAIKDRHVIGLSADIVDEKVERVANEMRERYRGQFLDYAHSFSFYRNAPLILVPYYRETTTLGSLMDESDNSILTWEKDNFTKSISCVTMLILLAAESLGLGACCVTGALIAEDELIKILRIKNGRRIGAIIPVGYRKPGILMDIDLKLRTMLLPVFGIESVGEISPEHSLVQDLGAESLDFVEIVFLVEKEFGVKLETREIVSGGTLDGVESFFAESRLTEEGERVIRTRFPDKPERFKAGMTKMDIFQSITVGDLERVIKAKIGGKDA